MVTSEMAAGWAFLPRLQVRIVLTGTLKETNGVTGGFVILPVDASRYARTPELNQVTYLAHVQLIMSSVSSQEG